MSSTAPRVGIANSCQRWCWGVILCLGFFFLPSLEVFGKEGGVLQDWGIKSEFIKLLEGWILQPSLLVGDIKFRSLFKMRNRCMKRCLKLLLV